VDYLKQFVIPFVGLSVGNHQFDFVIDDKFFASFEYSEIKSANIQVSLDLEKTDRMLILNFSITGTIRASCDRCLDEFDYPVEGNEEYFIKFGSEHYEEDVNVLVITENETHFEIAQLIYDYVNLLLPFKVVHPDDEDGNSQCDPDVLKRIEQHSVQKEIDARWDKLKDLNLD